MSTKSNSSQSLRSMQQRIGSGKLSNDLANWMTNLPPTLKNVPIIHLAIPGTHDSMTFGMTSRSPIAPDAYAWLQKLKWAGWPVRASVTRWSITQANNVKAQLEHGIRYLDLRLATKTNSSEFFFCHGLYCGSVSPALKEIASFLSEHSGEVVILDFQHFYDLSPNDHGRLAELIETTFGKKILPYSSNLNSVTLEYAKSRGFQVICIYRYQNVKYPFWPGNAWPTPWPETTSIPQLFAILDHNLSNRDQNYGYVSQCIITPDAAFILKNLLATLQTACAIKVHKPMMQWIADQSPGQKGLNVAICDYADINNWTYTKAIIDLNTKLL